MQHLCTGAPASCHFVSQELEKSNADLLKERTEVVFAQCPCLFTFCVDVFACLRVFVFVRWRSGVGVLALCVYVCVCVCVCLFFSKGA